ncbi:MAG: hypothetical protein CMD88_00215 [Gammaproteobacteria bacterium]|nr:hypothetical protein [Gammaproteobacteria bacterium]|tara:strand:- start:19762 stop:20286 length:525 start_codon:yes stop_codon:yes gene_type:complete
MKYKYLNKWLEERPLKNLRFEQKLMAIDNCSLTRRLSTIKKKVNITHINSCSKKINPELRLYFPGLCFVRSVELDSVKIDGLPIKALSIISMKNLTGKERLIPHLKGRSLGTFILKRKKYKKIYTDYSVHGDLPQITRNIIYRFKKKYIFVQEWLTFPELYNDLTLFECRRNFL